ncbi:MAG: EVE domain-containing protein [Bacteroidetes bacterium]|nr:EVE domain-containing protein [Bacteroidota bacterium]
MNYWLTKTEPGTYSWGDLARDRQTTWDGVRNFQARNNLKNMKKDDRVFIYHSGEEKAIVGIATVSREFFPDPQDAAWAAVALSYYKPLKNPVTLAQIKSDKKLAGMVLVKASRLSVQPVKKEEFDLVVLLSEK